MKPLIILLALCSCYQANAQLDSLKNLFKNLTGKEKKLLLNKPDTTNAEYLVIIGGLQKNKDVTSITSGLDKEGVLITIQSKKSAANIWKEMPNDVKSRFSLKNDLSKGIFYIIDNNPVVTTNTSTTAGTNTNTNPNTNTNGNNKPKDNEAAPEVNWDNPNVKIPSNYYPGKAATDSLKKLCDIYLKNKGASVAIASLVDRLTLENPGRETTERLIAYLRATEKIRVYPEYVHHIPDGTQLLITGKITDYYASNNAYGRPRIEMNIELRPAVSQKQLLQKYTVKKTGGTYSGKGNNEALEKLWHSCIMDAATFIIKNAKSWENLAKARTSKEEIAGVELAFDERVETKSAMESQIEYGEDRREVGRKRNLGLSEYYNDSVMTTIYPKIASDQYLEFKINGAKQIFRYGSKKLDENMSVSFKHNMWGVDGFEIKFSSINIVGDMAFKLFDPSSYKTARRFYFGQTDIVNDKIPGERQEVEFIANLFKDYKTDNMLGKKIPSNKFLIIASNKPADQKSNTITSGYIDIINYSTGSYGELEFAFYFKTKAITDASGKVVQQPSTVEGRMRIRGSFRPRIADSY